jgi:hypothetical protein
MLVSALRLSAGLGPDRNPTALGPRKEEIRPVPADSTFPIHREYINAVWKEMHSNEHTMSYWKKADVTSIRII